MTSSTTSSHRNGFEPNYLLSSYLVNSEPHVMFGLITQLICGPSSTIGTSAVILDDVDGDDDAPLVGTVGLYIDVDH